MTLPQRRIQPIDLAQMTSFWKRSENVPNFRPTMALFMDELYECLTASAQRYFIDFRAEGWPTISMLDALDEPPITEPTDCPRAPRRFALSNRAKELWKQCSELGLHIGVTEGNWLMMLACFSRQGIIKHIKGKYYIIKAGWKPPSPDVQLPETGSYEPEDDFVVPLGDAAVVLRDEVLKHLGVLGKCTFPIAGIASWAKPGATENPSGSRAMQRYAREVLDCYRVGGWTHAQQLVEDLIKRYPECFAYDGGVVATALKWWVGGELVPSVQYAIVDSSRDINGNSYSYSYSGCSNIDSSEFDENAPLPVEHRRHLTDIELDTFLHDDHIYNAARQVGAALYELVKGGYKELPFYATQPLASMFGVTGGSKAPLGVPTKLVNRCRSSHANLRSLLPNYSSGQSAIRLTVLSWCDKLKLVKYGEYDHVVLVDDDISAPRTRALRDLDAFIFENPDQRLEISSKTFCSGEGNNSVSLDLSISLQGILAHFHQVMGEHGRWVHLDVVAGIVAQPQRDSYTTAMRYLAEVMPASCSPDVMISIPEAVLHVALSHPLTFAFRVGTAGIVELAMI